MAWIAENGKYLAVLLGVLGGLPLLRHCRAQLGLRTWLQLLLCALGFSAASLLSALLFALLEQLLGGEALHFGAISLYGVFLICPLLLLAAAALLRRNAAPIFDAYALYALPSLFLMRCNCLLGGCCGGKRIPALGFAWPTRQTEMLFFAAMLLFLLRREKTRPAPAEGTAFPLLMCAYAALRFWLEWFRASGGSTLFHLAHIWSLAVFLIGLLAYRKQNAKRRREEKRGNGKC